MEKQPHNQGGIRLKRLNGIMITMTVVLAAALALIAYSAIRGFNRLEEATDRYILARKDIADMQAGSDYLTDRVRTYIVTGDEKSAEDFFYEVEVTRRRDLAIESMESLFSGTDSARYLTEALQKSNALAEIERYAMRLAAEGNDLKGDGVPAQLRTVQLTDADLALSKEEMLEKAREMVFDETYQTYKQGIRDNTATCEDILIGEMEASHRETAQRLENALVLQSFLIVVVVIAVGLFVFCNARLVIQPIHSLVTAISEDTYAAEQGAYELRFVSRAYNEALKESMENQEQLAYKASHDALTELYNRGAFEKAREKTKGRAQAMFIVDVDRFKQFNDEYGHAVGDRVLQKVARALKNHFREEDYVCRYGGDEFTVIMVHATSEMRPMVETKLESIRSVLKNTDDGLPPITLSIGVAFSDRPDPTDDILKDADAALYLTKERGKDGYSFYGDKT